MTNDYIIYKIKAYLETNNSSSIDLSNSNNLIVQNDGDGPFIRIWNIDLPEPSQADLDSTENITRAQLLLSSSMFVQNRITNYPVIGEQFDMLYHELNTSGSLSVSGSWFQSIKNVKDSYPKP
tara:strand:- start:41 stop:409 length:369 start_codon:yes stop_codon:yes gene_type:complete